MDTFNPKPVYLHFFDKELLSSLGNERYAENLTESFRKDFVLSILAIKEKAYLSLAQIFDNKVANKIYRQYYEVFNPYGCIDLYSNTFCLEDMFAQKREQYPRGDGNRTIYLQDNWKDYQEFEPNLIYNNNDTTNILEEKIVQDFKDNYLQKIAEKIQVEYSPKKLDKVLPYLNEMTQNRGKRAITKFLYKNELSKIDDSEKLYRLLALDISERYTQTYLSYENGVLVTGLSCHLDYYDHLSDNSTYYDLRIWRNVYLLMGCEKYIYSIGGEDICKIRRDFRYRIFIDNIRKMIGVFIEEYEIQEVKKNLLYYNNRKIQSNNNKINFINQNLESYLEYSEEDITSVEQFLNILQINSKKVKQKIAEKSNERSVQKVTNGRNVFVIYGRNKKVKEEIFKLLRWVDLRPYEWSTIVELTGEGTPTIYQSIDKAMDNVQAVIALFTPDDKVQLKEELLEKGEISEKNTYQPRPNVLFETGLAFGKDKKKTILVEVGKIRNITDLDGFNRVRLDGTFEKRKELINRLETLGCKIDRNSNWENQNFKSGI